MKKGDKYLKGTLGNLNVLVFPNENKEKEKQPDHRLVLSDGNNNMVTVTGLWVNEKQGKKEEKQKNVKGNDVY